MESNEIAALKERIERLQEINALLNDTLTKAARHLQTSKMIEAIAQDSRPGDCLNIVSAALAANKANNALNEALEALRNVPENHSQSEVNSLENQRSE